MNLSDFKKSLRAAEAAAKDMQTFASIYELATWQNAADVDTRPDAELICQLCCHLAKRSNEAISHAYEQFEALERSLE